jgi:hypothetical protein
MVRIARFVYTVAAWLFVAGVVAQVFLAGMVVVAGRSGWDGHTGLGHALAVPLRHPKRSSNRTGAYLRLPVILPSA